MILTGSCKHNRMDQPIFSCMEILKKSYQLEHQLEQTKKIVLAVGDAGGKTKLRIPTFGAARKRGISKLESCVERRFALHGSSRHSAVIHP